MSECDKCYKALWAVSKLEKRYRNASPFTNYNKMVDFLSLFCHLLACFYNTLISQVLFSFFLSWLLYIILTCSAKHLVSVFLRSNM